MESYITVERKATAEFTEKRSRFIANVFPVSKESDALEIIAKLKKEYWDAKHNVYAYVIKEGNICRYTDDGVRTEPVDRKEFQAAQTPQGFKLWRLREAYALPYQESFTDDASVMAEAGFTDIRLVEGNPDNIKITNPRDIIIAEALLDAESGRQQ